MHISDASQLGVVGSSSVLRLAVGTTGMTQLQDLKSLNKSSARVATFAAKLCDGIVEKYTYFQKISQQQVTAHKFEVTLVGSNPQEYCKGFVKHPRRTARKPLPKMVQYGLCPKSLSALTQQVNTSVHQSFTVWTSPSP